MIVAVPTEIIPVWFIEQWKRKTPNQVQRWMHTSRRCLKNGNWKKFDNLSYLKDTIIMKTKREECEKKFVERKLVMSDEKCKECEYFYLCPFIAMAMNEVLYGSD